MGIKTIQSELTFIVDSDDLLTPDAVETVLRYHSRYRDEKKLCGYAFLRAFPDGKVNGKLFVPDEKVCSYIDARIKADDTMADKAEVFRTDCLKEFPFPEYRDERFLGEDIVWVRMGRKYDMVHINKTIYIGEYQSDGLTKNRRANNIKSPVGCMHRAMEFVKPDMPRKVRIKAGLQYIVYGRFAGYSLGKLVKASKQKNLILLCAVPGSVLYRKWKRTGGRS